MPFDGIVPVWKEAGMTSHDVVGKMRRIFGQKRIGHAGTLDPDVCGVLVVCLGQATRLVERLQEQPKTYEATVLFGLATDTEDAGGTITEQMTPAEAADHVQRDRWRSVFPSFHGVIRQVPPMVSAVKIDGKKLYEYARAGVTVDRPAREVTIYELIELGWADADTSTGRYPAASFRVSCSKGTYVRTICTDMGKALGVPARMEHLVRTGSGSFCREQCFTLQQLQEAREQELLERVIIPLRAALPGWSSAAILDETILRKVRNGMALRSADLTIATGSVKTDEECLLLDPDGEPLGLYRRVAPEPDGLWKADIIFQSAADCLTSEKAKG